MEQTPTIYLLIHHNIPAGVKHALYKIDLPLDLSDYGRLIDSDGFMTDSDDISPLLTLKETQFLPFVTSATLGSKIYYFGGNIEVVKNKRLYCTVHVFDTQHPEQGMQTVAPLNFPKHHPCVFVAHGMIYALGAYVGRVGSEKRNFRGCDSTGHFERYDPSLDKWQILPDPPISDSAWASAKLTDCAVVMGHQVFIGSPHTFAIFNLKDQVWEPKLPPGPRRSLHCASFVPDTDSLYCFPHPTSGRDPVKVFKAGPLSLENFDKHQVVAEGTDLEDAFFANSSFMPHRFLLHMGGRFFCYVLSANFVENVHCTVFEPESRGVWIKILEVPTDTDSGNSNIKLRTLATFCYKINTDFASWACHICCSVLGTVPDSWIKAPLEKKLSIKLKQKNEGSMANQIQTSVTPTQREVRKAEQRQLKKMGKKHLKPKFDSEEVFPWEDVIHVGLNPGKMEYCLAKS